MLVSLARTNRARLLRETCFWKDTLSIVRRQESAAVSNKVFMSNIMGGRKLKFHCLQETEHRFSQEEEVYVTALFQKYLNSEILEMPCRGVYSSLGVDVRERSAINLIIKNCD